VYAKVTNSNWQTLNPTMGTVVETNVVKFVAKLLDIV